MSRRTSKARAKERDRLLHANVWSIRTLWHGTLKQTYRLVLVSLVLGLLGAAGWGGKVALDRLFYDNPDFRLQTVRLNPNEAIDERDFIAITGLELDTNLFRIDVKKLTRCLLAQPAIQNATVERQTPGTLIVNVTARTPRAWLACPDAGITASRETGGLLMAQHLAIRDAIRSRRPEAARLAAQTHISFVRQRLGEAADSEQRQQRSLRHFS